jgi:hypothetical protein
MRTSAADRDADAGNKARGAHACVVCRGARRAGFHTRHAERVDQGAGIRVAHVARVGGRRLAAAATRTTPATRDADPENRRTRHAVTTTLAPTHLPHRTRGRARAAAALVVVDAAVVPVEGI